MRQPGMLVAAAGLALAAGGVMPANAATPVTRFGLNMQHATLLATVNAMAPEVRQLGQRYMSRIHSDSPHAWGQFYDVESCAGGGSSCLSGGQYVAPLSFAVVEEDGYTPGGKPDHAEVFCGSITPNAGGIHVVDAASIGGDTIHLAGFTSAGTGGVANGAPSSTAAIGYDAAAHTTGYNLFYEDPAVPTTFGFTLMSGVNLTNNTTHKITGGHMIATAGPVIAQEDETWDGTDYNLGTITYSLGSMSCDATGNSGSFLREGYNIHV